ncbi:MAG TPA: hypothetical protein VMZ30_17695 [Pyrinomonadaceae bacterium]|nr:hypothetical protein [Pyrinomonadaceae bacterium]
MGAIKVRLFMRFAVLGLCAGSLLVADTLSLKTGESIVGTFSNGTQNEITFTTVNGITRRYSVRDVRSIEFAPLQSQSNSRFPGQSNDSRGWKIVDNTWTHFAYPPNWRITDEGDRILFSSNAPNGRVRGGMDAEVMVGMHRSRGGRTQGVRGANNGALEGETQNILAGLGGQMRDTRQVGSFEQLQIDGQRALRTTFTSLSPRGERQLNWLITAMHPQGVLYIVFGAPEQEFPALQSTFNQMQNSFRVR